MIDAKDEAFLADLAGFLDDFESLRPSIELEHQDEVPAQLLNSDQLLADTEIFLLAPKDDAVRPLEIQKAQAAKRRLKYRNKLQSERQTLQEEEKMMSEELSKLQRARKRVKLPEDKGTALSVWRAVATRQKEGRVVAEEQRQRLRKTVESRAKVFEEIEKMIRARMYRSESAEGTAMVAQQSNVQLNPDDSVLFEEFLHDLDAIYERTDEVFQACGVEENPVMSYRLGPDRKTDGDVEFVESLDVLLIPFSFEQTCSVMWQSMIHVYRQKDRYLYGGVADPESTVAVKLRLQPSKESGEPVDVLVHFVVRRYLEAERMIVVWRALSEGEGEFSGIHSDETGWCIVRPNNSDEPLMRTVMQTFVRFIPMDTANVSGGQVDGYQFTKLVVTSAEEDGAEIARMMDFLLLEDHSKTVEHNATM